MASRNSERGVIEFTPMRRLFVLLLLVAAGCGEEGNTASKTLPLSRTPVSIRGWIADIVEPPGAPTPENETLRMQRKIDFFRETNMSVENVPYASGGLGESGSFVILDAPPGRVVVVFLVPGFPAESRLVLENVPPNADVLIPGIVLHPDRVELADPSRVVVRLASNVRERNEIASNVRVAGKPVRLFQAPVSEMMDRRDYPEPAPRYEPIGIVR